MASFRSNYRTGVRAAISRSMSSNRPGDLERGAYCLIRPDGHIGWIGSKPMTDELTRYVHQWRIA